MLETEGSKMRRTIVSAVVALTLLVVACVGEDPAVASADADGGADGADGGSPEPIVEDTPCNPEEAPGDGLFVSGQGDDSAGDGSPGLPFKTITKALEKATSGTALRIHLDAGVYAEQVTVPKLKADVTIDGDWRATGVVWTRACGPNRRGLTIVRSPTAVGVRVDSVGAALTIQNLTVMTRAEGPAVPPPDSPGESTYGVFIRGAGTKVSLINVEVRAGSGGAAGKATNPPKPATVSTCACQGSSIGANGLDGADPPSPAGGASAPGGFSAEGFLASDGNPGAGGIAGANGGPPGTPLSFATCAMSDCNSGCNCPKTTNTALPTCVNYVGKSQLPGACGCGGLAGGVGGSGHGGGASVALFIANKGAIVSLDHVLLAAKDGGAGASGGLGGSGGDATAGAAGPPLTCYPNRYCWNQGPGCTAAVVDGTPSTTFAQAGGNGGKGGHGQGGGGGAGGSTVGIAIVDAADVKESGVGIVIGKPGVAGGPDSVAGEALERFR
jgi:hypothetical protein